MSVIFQVNISSKKSTKILIPFTKFLSKFQLLLLLEKIINPSGQKTNVSFSDNFEIVEKMKFTL